MGTLGTIACNFVCLRSYGLLNLKLNKMKEPKRYYCGNGEGMFEDKNGHWVEYSEHKAIVEALTEQLRKHTATYEFLCEKFEFGRDKKCEQQCSDCHWMQTKLNQPTVVGQNEQFTCSCGIPPAIRLCEGIETCLKCGDELSK